jgi:hypothetical protein
MALVDVRDLAETAFVRRSPSRRSLTEPASTPLVIRRHRDGSGLGRGADRDGSVGVVRRGHVPGEPQCMQDGADADDVDQTVAPSGVDDQVLQSLRDLAEAVFAQPGSTG